MGQRVKKKREEAGMTQKELAKRLNVHQSLVWRWESGDIQTIRPDNVKRICKELGCPYEYIMYGISGDTFPQEVEEWLHSTDNKGKVLCFYKEAKMAEKEIDEAIRKSLSEDK
jgi:transcriptional regulator with XRE-family HTH domain